MNGRRWSTSRRLKRLPGSQCRIKVIDQYHGVYVFEDHVLRFVKHIEGRYRTQVVEPACDIERSVVAVVPVFRIDRGLAAQFVKVGVGIDVDNGQFACSYEAFKPFHSTKLVDDGLAVFATRI